MHLCLYPYRNFRTDVDQLEAKEHGTACATMAAMMWGTISRGVQQLANLAGGAVKV